MMKEGQSGGSAPSNESREDVTYGNSRDTSNERDDDDHSPRKKKASAASSGGAAATAPQRQGVKKPPQHDSQQQPPHPGRYYPGMQPPQGHYPPPPGGGMPLGPYHGGPPYPPPYGAGGNGHYPPPPHYHQYNHSQMPPMPPPFNGGGPPPYPGHSMGSRQRGGNNGGAGNGPYGPHYGGHSHHYGPPHGYGQSHGMHPSYPPPQSMPPSDASVSSRGSKSSRKRTIDGVHESSSHHCPPIAPQSGNFRRSESNCSTTSTVTAGNNTSIETHDTEDTFGSSHHRHSSYRGDNSKPPAGGYNDESDTHQHHHIESRPIRTRYHRRDHSGDGSTTSSLSAGYSLASYERDQMNAEHPIRKSSPKRMKGKDGEPLTVDTVMRPPSAASHDADQSTRFEQLSIGVKEEEPKSTKSDSSNDSNNHNLFLTLSTSPINATVDVDATPISKNTTKNNSRDQKNSNDKSNKSSIFKKKPDSGLPQLEVSTSDIAGLPSIAGPPSSPLHPPVHGDLEDSDMMNDDHSTLNRHLRGQSFTPVTHLSHGNDQASTADGQFSIAPQLSWSIAGDTPSLGDLAEWEEESKSKHKEDHQKIKPSSTVDSHDSRHMSISPHDFHLFKDEHELVDQAINGATTPLPAFFESRGSSEHELTESHGTTNYEPRAKRHPGEDACPSFIASSSRHSGQRHSGRQHMPPHWSKHLHDHMGHGMPPTPHMYPSTEYRDDAFPMVRSPYGGDRRDQIDGAGAFPFFPHHGPGGHPNDRVRNLRGRMPPGAHYPPMLHIPPPMSAQLPMTSPMALPNKGGLWSPHHGMPPMGSPHHLTSPMGGMQTKRKCVPLKPPIPSKFQGDPDKVKNIPVPEFTSLVNFPSHMSQKQAVNLPEGMRCCVMCGNACPSSNGGKNNKNNKKKGDAGGLVQRSSNGQDMVGDKSSGYAQIPTQNKGLCTLCDVNVWVVCANGLEIKWCKGCKNFRPWAAFGDKGLATKCLRCRERQREKYALQKEEKEKARNATVKTKS